MGCKSSGQISIVLPTSNDTMSFRKRNIGLSGPTSQTPKSDSPSASNIPERSTHDATPLAQASGVRPSPLDGRPTTSTGTQTLDSLLTGHAGLALGNLILVEESGTTDFAGTLLRYYAAEGVVQGHRVHVVGVGEPWGRELPGLVPGAGIDAEDEVKVGVDREKMKIAWRYENLGDFDARASNIRGGMIPISSCALPVHRSILISRPSVFRFPSSC